MASRPESPAPHETDGSERDDPPAAPECAAHRVQLYMLCRDAARIAEWEHRRAMLPGVDLHLRTGYSSMYAFVTSAIRACAANYVVITHDDVIHGHNFGARVQALARDLDADFPNWGVVGNAGADIDGRGVVCAQDPWSQPTRVCGPQPVAALDGNVLMVNRRRFPADDGDYPDLGGFHGYDAVLAYECLRKGLLALVDPRLAVLHMSSGDRDAFVAFARSEGFATYARARFSNPSIPTSMVGYVKIARNAQRGDTTAEDFHDLFDRALAASRSRRPTLSIVRIGSGSGAMAANDTTAWAQMAPLVEVGHASIERDADRPLGQAIARFFATATSDYVWFLPADARVDGGPLRDLARVLATGARRVTAFRHLAATIGADRASPGPATGIVRAAFGPDAFPYWAAIYPVAALRARIAEAALSEDELVALLPVLAFTAPDVDLVVHHELVVVHGASPETEAASVGGYGSQAQWAHATRLGTTLSNRAFGSSTLWNLAAEGVPLIWNPTRRRLIGSRSRVARATISIGAAIDTGARALDDPRKSFRRARSLFALARVRLGALVRNTSPFRKP